MEQSLRICVAASAMAMVLSGCGRKSDGPERVVVSGTVALDGEPIQIGEVRFMPTKETKAPVSGAFIENGKYSVKHNGGVPVGTHMVVIDGFRPKKNPPALPANVDKEAALGGISDKEQYVPPQFNERTTLTFTVESGQKPITRNFELKSAGSGP